MSTRNTGISASSDLVVLIVSPTCFLQLSSANSRENTLFEICTPQIVANMLTVLPGRTGPHLQQNQADLQSNSPPTWDNLTTSLCSSSLPIPALGNKLLQAPGPLKHGQMILQDCFDLTAGPGDQPAVLKACAHQVL